jgi:hypothetical protein
MRLRLVLLLPLVAGLRCAAEPAPLRCWDDVAAAASEAAVARKPLLVVSIVGDLRKRC